MEPLFYRDEQLGFIVFEADPRLEVEYEILREQIAGALKRSALYRQAEQARLVAEEGRRLAEEANLLKSRFLSTVSHELRTPLSLIVGTIEMLMRNGRRTDLPTAYHRDLQNIRTSAQHLARLISDVLDLASSQAGELHLVGEPLHLCEVLARAAMLGEVMAREKGLSWEAEVPSDLPCVWGDRTRLQQIVLNLVSNAVKFTERGYVRLWAEAGKEQVVVAVTDSGMGILASEQEFIFDEFRQSERTARRGYGGMGLGLAISRRLVELHGGTIGVLSTGSDGAGSTFYFTLPVLALDGQVATDNVERAGDVLVLTERPAMAQRLGRHLVQSGFNVEALAPSDNPRWLAEIIAAPPGAILLDSEPGVESGWELMRVLRHNPGTQDIPVIFYNLTEAEERGGALALDFAAKPLSPGPLAAALARKGLNADGHGRPTVLIVDDDPGILALHARLLEEVTPPCRVITACNGEEALARMAGQRPDLVLLDLMMPVLDGFGVLEAMHEREGLRDIPVIVLTAQILTREDMTRLQQGVAAVLNKALFTGAEVLDRISEALRRNRRLGSEAQRVVRQAMAYMHEHYAEDISRETLAEAVGFSDRYLTRCFHTETGITPVAYLTRYRIRQARSLLDLGELSVTEVALATGFTDASYFARVFRSEVGVSPAPTNKGNALRHSSSLPFIRLSAPFLQDAAACQRVNTRAGASPCPLSA